MDLFDFMNEGQQLTDLERELAYRLDITLGMLSEFIEDDYDEEDDYGQYAGGPSKSCH